MFSSCLRSVTSRAIPWISSFFPFDLRRWALTSMSTLRPSLCNMAISKCCGGSSFTMRRIVSLHWAACSGAMKLLISFCRTSSRDQPIASWAALFIEVILPSRSKVNRMSLVFSKRSSNRRSHCRTAFSARFPSMMYRRTRGSRSLLNDSFGKHSLAPASSAFLRSCFRLLEARTTTGTPLSWEWVSLTSVRSSSLRDEQSQTTASNVRDAICGSADRHVFSVVTSKETPSSASRTIFKGCGSCEESFPINRIRYECDNIVPSLLSLACRFQYCTPPAKCVRLPHLALEGGVSREKSANLLHQFFWHLTLFHKTIRPTALAFFS